MDRGRSAAPSAPRRRWFASQRTQLLVIGGVLMLVLVLAAGALAVVLGLGRSATLPPGTPEVERPGELISSAPIDGGLPDGLQGWRIRYGTTDARGEPVEASGVVLAGAGGSGRARPVLSVGHGTLGIDASCGPSLARRFPTPPVAVVDALVRRGWVAVQADYVGLGVPGPAGVHPYLDGPSEGYAVLDATRAARQLEGLRLSRKTVVYGTSQGGHAALFAGQEASRHAPDLDVLGVAAVAPATDLARMLAAMNGSSFGLSINSYLAVAWNAVHPEAGIPDLVGDWPLAERLAGQCAQRALRTAAQQRDAEPVFDAADVAGPLRELFAANTPTAPVAAPLLIAQGSADRIVLPELQQAYVAARCAAGQHIDYRVLPGRTHVTISAEDSPLIGQMVGWAEDRLAGRPPTPTC